MPVSRSGPRLIRIRGAAEHNLKNVSLDLPRERLSVFTGVSRSGKSSLIFDTIYKEGQRRFLESLSAYARQFLGGFEKPRVESIEGLSPTISIDQKTVGRSPRSTVGTISEVHDHLRLLFARIGEPHCPRCGRPIASQSADRIGDLIGLRFPGKLVLVCAPLVRGRKGEYRQLFEELRAAGHTRLRIDGRVVRLDGEIEPLKKHEKHDIDLVCDRLEVRPELRGRIVEAVEKSLEHAGGVTRVVAVKPTGGTAGDREWQGEGEEPFSSQRACPDCGISLLELEPRLFSFNSPHGACEACDGLGEVDRVDPELVVADPSLPLVKGGIELVRPGGELADEDLDPDGFAALGKRIGLTRRTSWGDLDAEARQKILFGDGKFAGLVAGLEELARSGDALAAPYVRSMECTACGGSRLKAVSRAVTVHGKSIADLGRLPIGELRSWLGALPLTGAAAAIGAPIVRNVLTRLQYLE